MTHFTRRLTLGIVCFSLGAGAFGTLSGCDDDEDLGDKMEDVGDDIEEAGKDLEREIEDATD